MSGNLAGASGALSLDPLVLADGGTFVLDSPFLLLQFLFTVQLCKKQSHLLVSIQKISFPSSSLLGTNRKDHIAA